MLAFVRELYKEDKAMTQVAIPSYPQLVYHYLQYGMENEQ